MLRKVIMNVRNMGMHLLLNSRIVSYVSLVSIIPSSERMVVLA